MPQTTDELREQWPGGDTQAMLHLEAKGFTLTKEWEWILPFKTYKSSERDTSAIEYLITEWDFGGCRSSEHAPDKIKYRKPVFHAPLQYCLGILMEECCEAGQMIGKALRFGWTRPGFMGPDREPDLSTTPEEKIQSEIGDILAAIEYSFLQGVLSREQVMLAKDKKLHKLLNDTDNMGFPLAPPLPKQSVETTDMFHAVEDLNLGLIGRFFKKIKNRLFSSKTEF